MMQKLDLLFSFRYYWEFSMHKGMNLVYFQLSEMYDKNVKNCFQKLVTGGITGGIFPKKL